MAVGAQDELKLSLAHRLALLISQRQANAYRRSRGSDRKPGAPLSAFAAGHRDDESRRRHARSDTHETEGAGGELQNPSDRTAPGNLHRTRNQAAFASGGDQRSSLGLD